MLTGNGVELRGLLRSGSTLFQVTPRQVTPRANRQGNGPDFPLRPRRENRGTRKDIIVQPHFAHRAGGDSRDRPSKMHSILEWKPECHMPPTLLFGAGWD